MADALLVSNIHHIGLLKIYRMPQIKTMPLYMYIKQTSNRFMRAPTNPPSAAMVVLKLVVDKARNFHTVVQRQIPFCRTIMDYNAEITSNFHEIRNRYARIVSGIQIFLVFIFVGQTVSTQ